MPENCSVRCILFRECERKGKKLLFDSSTVVKIKSDSSGKVENEYLKCFNIYIYNAEFTTAVMLVHKTVEIEGNEFRQSKYFNLLELPSKVRLTY